MMLGLQIYACDFLSTLLREYLPEFHRSMMNAYFYATMPANLSQSMYFMEFHAVYFFF